MKNDQSRYQGDAQITFFNTRRIACRCVYVDAMKQQYREASVQDTIRGFERHLNQVSADYWLCANLSTLQNPIQKVK
jgi:hypothetical protein